jgi:uncharacterized protein
LDVFLFRATILAQNYLHHMPRRFSVAILIAMLGILTFTSSLVRLVTDWWWFEALDLGTLFSTRLVAATLIGAGFGLVTLLVILMNLWIAFRATRSRRTDTIVIGGRTHQASIFAKLTILGASILSVLTALTMGTSWPTVLQFINQQSFDVMELVFQRDVSFFVFTLPLLKIILNWGLWTLALSAAAALSVYVVRGVVKIASQFRGQNLLQAISTTSAARAHLLTLLTLAAILVATRLWHVAIPELVYATTGPVTGVSFTELYARVPLLRALSVLSGLVAVAAGIGIVRGRIRYAVAALVFYGIVSAAGPIAPWAMQRFVVDPNELVKERGTIERNVAATRAAYALDRITARDFTSGGTIDADDIAANGPTIRNVRLWDREPLLDTFGQLQEIRTYYGFSSIDNDRYQINGELRQVLLSPRELTADALPADTFVNRDLTFTHGYGLTLGPVNEVTPEGLPLLFVKDLPPVASSGAPPITRPELYYAEQSHDPIFTNTAAEEFDYPSGDDNVFTTYTGDGGIEIRSLGRKALFAWRFGSFDVLLSNDIVSDSRIHFTRDIEDRAKKLFPFLAFDRDPYLVVRDDGRLTWMMDAYTRTNRYPNAEQSLDIFSRVPGATFNYLRNSVKVTIDAYDGRVTAYIVDPEDPLIQTWSRIFPDVFSELATMPEDLRAHMRYPEDLFAYQAARFSKYHMTDPQAFYNQEDQWVIPRYGRSGDPMLRHLVMRLPGEDVEEFVLMLPFTPRGKQNMAAWMAARSDGDAYGELVAFQFPKQSLVFGPEQIVNRINQNPDISRQISLWDQRGSEVIHGNLLVIPIEEALLYIQPLYLRAEGGKIPELKRVIVAHGNDIAMAETLDVALSNLFGTSRETTEGEQPPPKAAPSTSALERAREHFNAALSAQRRGDWARYGAEIRALEEALQE